MKALTEIFLRFEGTNGKSQDLEGKLPPDETRAYSQLKNG